MKKINVILFVFSAVSVQSVIPYVANSASVGYEYSYIERKNTSGISSEGGSNGFVLDFEGDFFDRKTTYELKYINEDLDSSEIQETYSTQLFGFQVVHQVANSGENKYTSVVMGLSYVDYDVYGMEEEEFIGITLGGSFAYPLIGSDLLLTGTLDLNLFFCSNEEKSNGDDMTGFKGDLGLVYMFNDWGWVKPGVRVGYKYRKLSSDNELFEDEIHGPFAAIRMYF